MESRTVRFPRSANYFERGGYGGVNSGFCPVTISALQSIIIYNIYHYLILLALFIIKYYIRFISHKVISQHNRDQTGDASAMENTLAQMLHADSGLGMSTLEELEGNLTETIQWILESKDPRSVLDTHILYYSSLKLVEFRVMSSAARGIALKEAGESKDSALHESLIFSTQALRARPLCESYDLHFIATIRLAQLLLNARRRLAAPAVGKALLVLSSVMNKLSHTTLEYTDCHKLLSDLELVIRVGILSASGYGRGSTVWSKRHSGATNLTLADSIPGYANWCFEEGDGTYTSLRALDDLSL